MNRIQIVSGEVFRVIPGSLYPAPHRPEAGGLVKAEWVASGNNRSAKFYKLTSVGKSRLMRNGRPGNGFPTRSS